MQRRAGVWFPAAIIIAIISGALLPVKWKLALYIGYRYYPISIFHHVVGVNFHALAHAVAFGGALLLLLRNSKSNGQRLLGLVVLVFLAFATEAAEYFISRGRFEWEDLKVDLFALAVAGILAIPSYFSRSPQLSFLDSQEPGSRLSTK